MAYQRERRTPSQPRSARAGLPSAELKSGVGRAAEVGKGIGDNRNCIVGVGKSSQSFMRGAIRETKSLKSRSLTG